MCITEEFIKKTIPIHSDKYAYSKVNYIGSKINVIIVCPVHGEFEQSPNSHLQGRGCPKCGIIKRKNNRTKTTKEFIIEAKIIHENKYDYSLVKYINLKTKVKIICPVHGKFEQTPKSHLLGCGCRRCGRIICGNKLRLETNIFIDKSNEIHSNKYDYSKVKYVNSNHKIIIICPVHGEFTQQPTHHLSGSGCPICCESKGEKIIRLFLEDNNINYMPQHKFSNCKNVLQLPFDFYLPELNTCIEYNGRQHYEPIEYFGGEESLRKQQLNDKIKMEYCYDNNTPLIIIKYNDNILRMLRNI